MPPAGISPRVVCSVFECIIGTMLLMPRYTLITAGYQDITWHFICSGSRLTITTGQARSLYDNSLPYICQLPTIHPSSNTNNTRKSGIICGGTTTSYLPAAPPSAMQSRCGVTTLTNTTGQSLVVAECSVIGLLMKPFIQIVHEIIH